jgi:hypothetical protein
MRIKFTILNMDRDQAQFMVEKFAPAFGLEIVQCSPARFNPHQVTFTLEGEVNNAKSFEKYTKAEVHNLNGTYTEK